MRKPVLLSSILGCSLCFASSPQVRVSEQDNFPSQLPTKEVIISKPVVKNATEGNISLKENLPLKERRNAPEEGDEAVYPVEIEILGGNYNFALYVVNEQGAEFMFPEMDFDFDEETGLCSLMLPAGTVDLVLEFDNVFINQEVGYFINRGLAYYFIEDVVVDENTPRLKADVNECQILPVSIVMANGEPIEWSTKHWDGTQMGEPEGGNCVTGSSSYTFYNKKYDNNTNYVAMLAVPSYYTGIGLDADTDNPLSYWIPACNKASENWSCIIQLQTFTTDWIGGYAALSLNTTQSVEMKAENYKKHDWNFPTEGIEAIEYDFGLIFNNQDICMEQVQQVITDKPFDINFAIINKAEGIENLSIMEQSKMGLVVDDSDPEWPEIFGILSPWSRTNSTDCIFQPATTMFTRLPWEEDWEHWHYLPEFMWGNEYANYSQKDLGIKFGTTTPFVVSSVWKFTDHDTDETMGFSLVKNILDLAGTDRTEYDMPLSEVYFNGEQVKGKDDESTDFLDYWSTPDLGTGTIKYVLYDMPDFKIEGMQPTNVTEITYNQVITAWEPPTLTSLLFEDGDATITNRFASKEDASIKFFAGGTEWHRFWYLHPYANRWFAHDSQSMTYDVTAKVEYAPYGTDDWATLEVTEDAAQQSPALGNHYTCSLNQVEARSENGWFDVRITLETPEGNSQVQTLSPAFFIEGNKGTGVLEIERDNVTARYFDVFGMPVSEPSHGQLLIRIDANGASKIIF